MKDSTIAPLPHVAIQVFSETAPVAAVVEEARNDRRMAKTHMRVQAGGAAAAVEAFREATTPNVIVIETVQNGREALLSYLDELASYCDEGTHVIIIGHMNDVQLYRELISRGVSDYLVGPIDVVGFITALSQLFHSPSAKPIGKSIAVIGAKGGVGASTIAHNLGYVIAHSLQIETVIADLDLPFGTAGLDFNQDPPQGTLEALLDPARVEGNMVERLLSRCAERLQLMAAPSSLDRVYDFGPEPFEAIYDALRHSLPAIVLDVPHMWTSWVQRSLVRADEIVVVAAPDLANLRNAKNLIDTLAQARPNDPPPRLVLNQVGVQKRPEIAAHEFAKALDCEALAVFAFDAALFGNANNNGQMIAELQPKSKAAESFLDMARGLMGRQEIKVAKKSLFSPLLEKVASRLASLNAA